MNIRRRFVVVSLAVSGIFFSVSLQRQPIAADSAPKELRNNKSKRIETDQEKIKAVLQQRVSLNFDEAPLSEAIEFIRDYSGINIVVDAPGLDSIGWDEDAPMTLSVENIPLDEALDLLLAPLQMRHVVNRSVLLITAQDQSVRRQSMLAPPDLSLFRALSVQSPAEARIEKMLTQPISFDFDEAPLSDAITYIREYTGIGTVLDTAGFDALSLDEDTPVTLAIEQISLVNALRLLLDPLELVAIVKHDVLFITSMEEVEADLSTEAYFVADLLATKVGDDVVVGDPQSMVEMIRTTVGNDSWEENGGAGSVAFDPNTGCLTVRQSRLVHRRLADLLVSLRRGTELRKRLFSTYEINELEVSEQLIGITEAQRERELQRELAEIQAKNPVNQRARAELELLELQLEKARLEVKQLKAAEAKSNE